jgi:hypothetical protein
LLAGTKRKRNLDEEIKNNKGNYKRPAGVFKNILKYHSESSDNSSDSDSSEYDFIKKAKEQSEKASSAVKVTDIDAINQANNIKRVLNKVAQEIFSILPNAKNNKGGAIMSISGGLRLNREIEFVDPLARNQHVIENTEQEEDEDDGVLTVNRNEQINKDDYEREKLRQVSRSEFIQEQHERMARMQPSKDDKSKNNLRSLAFDCSGTLEADRATNQKNFVNAKKKYGW